MPSRLINEHRPIGRALIGRYPGNNDPRTFEECCFTSIAWMTIKIRFNFIGGSTRMLVWFSMPVIRCSLRPLNHQPKKELPFTCNQYEMEAIRGDSLSATRIKVVKILRFNYLRYSTKNSNVQTWSMRSEMVMLETTHYFGNA